MSPNRAADPPGSKKLTSVALELYIGTPGESSPLKTVTHDCGTYNFGTVASGAPVFFEVHAINGDTSQDRSNFLDANVGASY
jgi:hypothetical protein